ncbi:LysE family transporter [Sinanaerobacter sp. ZZT-01]|uniref:LysE family transporter n=1 Tax=Sinanaerobacter sp. ZZT-01 TaxID=3111540 RepID=UPI002D7702A9|nr:LysE family transporter [Sinanaerobacter sp. ZZT-01]WRR93650.1 LysE family transporter [Sinanaerobacter sp. ZZT-01]
MIWIGSGYLIWLAWQMLKYEVVIEEMEVRKNLFLHGLFLQFLNPNTILYEITVFSTFIVPFYKSFSVLVLLCFSRNDLLVFVWILISTIYLTVWEGFESDSICFAALLCHLFNGMIS